MIRSAIVGCLVVGWGVVGYLIVYGLPLILITAAAGLGVGTVVFFKGGVAPKDVTSAAVALAAGIPIVGAISYAVGSSEELTDIYGAAVLKYLWAVCLAAFVMGAVFGSGVP
jgi:hypothetical protein